MSKIRRELRFGLVALICVQLTGCATDQQRTKTGGTVIGAGIGAILGAALAGGLMAAVGGTREQVTSAAIAGGTAGLLAGGYKGYQWGSAVARKKAQYINSEDYISATIGDARSLRQTAASENTKLQSQIPRIAARQGQLRQAYASQQISQARYLRELNEVNAMVANETQLLNRMNQEISIQRSAQQQAASQTSIAMQNSHNEEISALERQRDAFASSVSALKSATSGISAPVQSGAYVRTGGGAVRDAHGTRTGGGVVRDAHGTLYLDSAQ